MPGLDFRGAHRCAEAADDRASTAAAAYTQIGKVLAHALKESKRGKVGALVYIGDAMEEHVDDLAAKAGDLGLHGVPVFVFQEGRDGVAERTFKEIARVSKGAWFRFDRNSAATLARLLSAVAVFATGGLKALEARGRAEDRLMIEHSGGGGKMSAFIDILAGSGADGAARCRLPAHRCRDAIAAIASRWPVRLRSALLGVVLLVIGTRRRSAAFMVAARSPGIAATQLASKRPKRRRTAARRCGRRRSKWSSTMNRARWKAWCSPAATKARRWAR